MKTFYLKGATKMNNIEKTHNWILNRDIKDFKTIDLTCGNGHDTKFLANNSREVIAVDIQLTAINNTKKRLKDYDNVTYIHSDHSEIDFNSLYPIDGAIYNLGYLPHGNKDLITKRETTIKSLNNLLPQLSDFLVVTCYPGHKGGDIEALAVKQWIDENNLKATSFSYNTPRSPIAYCIALK